ncbi:MAG: TlpA disulfide reductase family protein [Glaciecola sp.]|jgi:thiol-disulfide isomerase/thioredoxin
MRLLLLLLLVLSPVCVKAAQSGEKAPNIALHPTAQSVFQAHMLQDLQGRVVYIDFWASWCVPCRRSFPWMEAMHQKYAKHGLVIIAVNLDEDTALADSFLAQNQASFHIEFNPSGEVAQKFALRGMPSSYLIDKEGDIAVAHTGFFTSKTERYEAQIKALLDTANLVEQDKE